MIRQVTVIGLGLIGGSVALALRAIGGVRVAGVDSAAVLELPEAREASDERVPVDDVAAVRELLARTELAVLAMPVGGIIAWLPTVLELARYVTDCGSTKERIVAAAGAEPRRRFFVGGHPMAGKAIGGLGEASPTLFRGARWLLCPATADPEALRLVEGLVSSVGAKPVHVDAAVHDRGVALTSHLPQLCASALAVLAGRADAGELAGPAFASATRVAGGPDSMWADIFSTNAGAIANALRALTSQLEAVADGLERSPPDLEAALRLLGEARRVVGRLPSAR